MSKDIRKIKEQMQDNSNYEGEKKKKRIIQSVQREEASLLLP